MCCYLKLILGKKSILHFPLRFTLKYHQNKCHHDTVIYILDDSRVESGSVIDNTPDISR